MKKILITLPFLLVIYYIFTRTSLENKYKIISEIIIDNQLPILEICDKSERITIFENNLSEFTWFDQLSVNCQKIFQFKTKLNPNTIKYFNIKTKRFEYCRINRSCDTKLKILYRISLPIVSYDKKTVLIKIVEDCNCMLGGHSGEFVFKKINGKWKFIEAIDWIIS